MTASARPFVVETFNAEVRVLGTRFNVRAWPGTLEPATTVALETGRVTLAPAGQPDAAVAMAPGETRRVGTPTSAAPDPAELSVADATAWMRGDLVFKNQFVGVILGDVARHFAIDLRMPLPAFRQKQLNLAFRQPEDAETVVRDIAFALGLQYRETSNGYTFYTDAP